MLVNDMMERRKRLLVQPGGELSGAGSFFGDKQLP
jgi:hypothetical protein